MTTQRNESSSLIKIINQNNEGIAAIEQLCRYDGWGMAKQWFGLARCFFIGLLFAYLWYFFSKIIGTIYNDKHLLSIANNLSVLSNFLNFTYKFIISNKVSSIILCGIPSLFFLCKLFKSYWNEISANFLKFNQVDKMTFLLLGFLNALDIYYEYFDSVSILTILSCNFIFSLRFWKFIANLQKVKLGKSKPLTQFIFLIIYLISLYTLSIMLIRLNNIHSAIVSMTLILQLIFLFSMQIHYVCSNNSRLIASKAFSIYNSIFKIELPIISIVFLSFLYVVVFSKRPQDLNSIIMATSMYSWLGLSGWSGWILSKQWLNKARRFKLVMFITPALMVIVFPLIKFYDDIKPLGIKNTIFLNLIEFQIYILISYFILIGVITQIFVANTISKSLKESKKESLVPIEEPVTDLDQVEKIVGYESDFLKTVHNFIEKRIIHYPKQNLQNRSQVYAINASWGAGKSSFISLVKSELIKDKKIIWVDFNPWNYLSGEKMILDFFKTLDKRIREIYLHGLGSNLKKYINLLSVSHSAKLLDIFNLNIELAQNTSKADLASLKQDIETKLGSIKERIIIVIDDIDRLPPDMVLIILRLVGITANFPNIFFILAMDYKKIGRLIIQELGKDYENYLQKIVNENISLPSWSAKDLRKFFWHYTLNAREEFQNLTDAKGKKIVKELKDAKKFIYNKLDKSHINLTPRDIKQLASTYIYSVAEVFDESIKTNKSFDRKALLEKIEIHFENCFREQYSEQT